VQGRGGAFFDDEHGEAGYVLECLLTKRSGRMIAAAQANL
jgi:hypothetical protein